MGGDGLRFLRQASNGYFEVRSRPRYD